MNVLHSVYPDRKQEPCKECTQSETGSIFVSAHHIFVVRYQLLPDDIEPCHEMTFIPTQAL